MMKAIVLFTPILVLLFHPKTIAQQNDSVRFYSGVYIEYSTLILFAHDLKLYSDFNYLSQNKLQLFIQPGAEMLYSIPGAKTLYGGPYIELSLLNVINLFPNYGISIKPFFGVSYLINNSLNNNETSNSNFRYGATLQLNLSEQFKLIGKIMNVPKYTNEGVQVFIGFGIIYKIN